MSAFMNVVVALCVRMSLMIHVFFAYWKASDAMVDKTRWIFTVLISFQILEGFYSIFVRQGREYKWFCPCFFFYFVSVCPAIWILEVDRVEQYDSAYNSVNGTAIESQLSSISGFTIPLTLSADIWVAVIEQSLLFLVILNRWFLPSGGMTKDELSQLLFVYLSMASDNLEVFSLFDESSIRKDRTLTLVILSAWSLSLVQFAFVFVARTKDGGGPTARTGRIVDSRDDKPLKKGFFSTDIWTLTLMFLLADGPFLCIRLYSIIYHSLITYTILFFTFKNMIVIMFAIYRLFVIFCPCCHDRNVVDPIESGTIPEKR